MKQNRTVNEPSPDEFPNGNSSKRWSMSPPARFSAVGAAVGLPAAGLVLFVISNGRWAVPVAAWLAPVVILHWTRRQPALRGYLVLSVLLAAGNMVAWWGAVSPPGVADSPGWVPAALGPAIALVYLADRCIVPGLATRLGRGHLVLTLPFPLAYTVLDFALARVSPLGSVGAIGYTQYPNLALAQLASVTGVWGLTFLVAWLAPVTESVWTEGVRMRRWSSPLVVYGLVLALVLGYGGVRLGQAPTSGRSVRVAGITLVDRTKSHELEAARQAGRAAFDRANGVIRREGRDAALREAAAGARLVAFSETSIRGDASQEDDLVAWGAELAREANTTLVLPLYLSADTADGLDQNLLVILDPRGQVVLRHVKFGSAGLEGIVPGSGVLGFTDLPFGRVGAVICRDLDFPSIIQQAGTAGADLVVAPSFDWFEIDPFHTRYAVFRAIENGFSLVRPAGDGLSIATDPYGRVVAAMDQFQSSGRVMIATVPTTGVRTLYGMFGDWFGWTSLTGLALLIAAGMVGHRRRRPASPTPSPSRRET